MATLWGGRFTKDTDSQVYAFNASIGFDKRLYKQDIEGSIAHVVMLAKQGILTSQERDVLIKGLTGIREDVEAGRLVIDETYEDIHSFVEANLIQRVGSRARSCTPAAAATTRWRWTCVCTPGPRCCPRTVC